MMDISIDIAEIKNTRAAGNIRDDDPDALRVYKISVKQGEHEYFYEVDADLFDIRNQGRDLPDEVHALFVEADFLFGVK